MTLTLCTSKGDKAKRPRKKTGLSQMNNGTKRKGGGSARKKWGKTTFGPLKGASVLQRIQQQQHPEKKKKELKEEEDKRHNKTVQKVKE